ncbi:MAG: hypothetical protein M1819_003686 [Sarea resinae]|nr:MAG: hypothetical protein M1819_003686 [Sarea resinae]
MMRDVSASPSSFRATDPDPIFVGGGTGSPAPAYHANETTTTDHDEHNTMDDVFGSPSPSPPTSPITTTANGLSVDDTSSDISRRGTQGPSHEHEHAREHDHEPSDIPRLRSTHSTAGYRDGIASAKSSHIQTGFDEGWPLGAVMGLRVGCILGILEGLYSACAREGQEDGSEGQRFKSLLSDARKALCAESIFSPAYFGSDGVWLFDVRPAASSASAGPSPPSASPAIPSPGQGAAAAAAAAKEVDGGAEDEDEDEITFVEVTESHPLISKWRRLAEAEAYALGIDLSVYEDDDDGDETPIPDFATAVASLPGTAAAPGPAHRG